MLAIPDVVTCPNCSSEIHYVATTNFITCTNCFKTIEVELTVIREVIEEHEEMAQPTELELLGQQLVDIDLRLLMGGM